MSRRKEKIIIQQPPIQELGKRRSCIKRTCVTGCFFIILFFVGIFLLVKFITTPRVREVHKLPEGIQQKIIIYDPENIDTVKYIPGRDQHTLIETIAVIPKIILSPIILNLEKRVDPSNSTWQAFMQFMYEPITDTRDLYTIEWTDLHATTIFITNYYETNLKKQGFTVTTEEHTLHFSKDDISGTLYIEEDNDTNGGADYILLRVLLSP